MNRGDVYTFAGIGRAEYAVVVSNRGFNDITKNPMVVKVSDRPDLQETPYIVELGPDDPADGYLESYSVVRARLGQAPVGRLTNETLHKLDDALALLFDYPPM